MKRELLIIMILMLLFALLPGSALAKLIPHPMSDYDLSTYSGTVGEIKAQVQQEHTSYLACGQGPSPLLPLSSAVLWSNQVARSAVDKMFSAEDDREEAWVEQQLLQEIFIKFQVRLYSGLDARQQTELRKEASPRVYLESSDGRIAEAFRVFRTETEEYEWGYITPNIVQFPSRDQDGCLYINKYTEWIRLWIDTGCQKVYFHYDFLPLSRG